MTISHLKSPPAAAWDPGTALSLTRLWQQAGFSPNDEQQQAILHVAGPLFLPAGPGSGKTRVLLWRTLNLGDLEYPIKESNWFGKVSNWLFMA